MAAKFPASFPFKPSDFSPEAKFLNVDGAPMVLFPSGPTLVNFFGGEACIISTKELKVDNQRPTSFSEFAGAVDRTRSYKPSWATS